MVNHNDTCCFIGHSKFYDDEAQIKRWILECVHKAIEDGFKHFMCGGGMGFDMLAAQIIVDLKKSGHKISLELALPYRGEYKPPPKRYLFSIIEANADKVSYVKEYYTKNCYIERNKYMVDKSALVVVYCREYWGGTHNIIEYAKELERVIYAL